jgi:hypothetical protein
MKARFADIVLSDGLFEGPSGFSHNGQQINDRFDLVRAAQALFVPRGNRSATISFAITRQKDSLRGSERFVLEHFSQLPEQGDLFLWVGTDADGEWVKYPGAVIDNVSSFYRGVSPGFQYTFSVGAPVFDESPPDVTPPDDDMKRGTAEFDDGDQTVDVTFAAPFSGPPTVVGTLLVPDGGDYMTCQILESTITATGFTARLNAAAPGTGYKLSWMAIL